MKLATFRASADETSLLSGEVRGDSVIAFSDGTTVLDRLASGDRTPADGAEYPLSGVQLVAPHRPPIIFCVGWNYLSHIKETGQEVPESPLVFLKPPAAATGPFAAVRCPPVVRRLDYEVELTAVIGQDGRVAGYTVANDVSGRDLQKREGQWTRAKGADDFCPFGPWITTTDEIPDPHDLFLRTWVNGELRQDSRTNDLLFPIDKLVEHISAACALEPGALILTGTPSGVGIGLDPMQFLKSGDVVRMEIESLGAIENTIA